MSFNMLAAVFKIEGLKPMNKHLLASIASHYNANNGDCFPSLSRIQKTSGLSRPSVLANRRELIEQGLISIDTAGSGRESYNYRFNEKILKGTFKLELVNKLNQSATSKGDCLVKELSDPVKLLNQSSKVALPQRESSFTTEVKELYPNKEYNKEYNSESNKEHNKEVRTPDFDLIQPSASPEPEPDTVPMPPAAEQTPQPESQPMNTPTDKPKRKPKPKPVLDEALFAEFWEAYPRKEAKKDARAAFAKNGIDRAKLDLILANLEWRKTSPQWTKDNGEFVPYPATYLNKGRYEDEKKPEQPNTAFSFGDEELPDPDDPSLAEFFDD